MSNKQTRAYKNTSVWQMKPTLADAASARESAHALLNYSHNLVRARVLGVMNSLRKVLDDVKGNQLRLSRCATERQQRM